MNPQTVDSRLAQFFLTRFCLRVITRIVVIALLLTLPFLAWAFPANARSGVPEFLLFIGRFHPLVLHLPIGLFVLLPVLHLLARVCPPQTIRPAIVVVLWLAVGSVFAAMVCGLALSQEGGYAGDTLIFHRRLALVLTVLAGLLLLSESEAANPSPRRAVFSRRSRMAYRTFLPLTLVCLGVAAHLGASITHGSTFLTDHLPRPMKTWIGGLTKPVVSQEDDPYISSVAPILSARCTSCHGAEKAKGGLRLHTLAAILAGGDSQRDEQQHAVILGKPDESLLLSAICLPEDDDAHMPPNGKPQLTADQAAVLRAWIESGAVAPKAIWEEAAKHGPNPRAKILSPPPDRKIVSMASMHSMFPLFRAE